MKRAKTDKEEEHDAEIVRINAGGKLYYTTAKTLTGNFPDSLIAMLFRRRETLPRDEAGNYFIDVDPVLFGAVLNVLRRPRLAEVVPKGITEESWWHELDYWGIRDHVVQEEEVEPTKNLPKGLADKVVAFKEMCDQRQRELARQELLIVDKLLECCFFNEELTFSQDDDAVGALKFMAPEVLYLRDDKFISKQEAQPDDLDVVVYVENNAVALEKLIKQVMGFDEVSIDCAPCTRNFTFCGVEFEGSGLITRPFISFEHHYR